MKVPGSRPGAHALPGRLRPMPKRLRIALVALVWLGCASVKVTTETTPGADLSRYHSYAIAPPEDGVPAIRDRVASEIAIQLDRRGFEHRPLGEADLVVAFRGSRADRQRLTDAGDPDATWYVVQHYQLGTLVITVSDAASHEHLWTGTGQIDLFSKDDAQIAKDAERAVEAVLAAFPGTAAPAPETAAPPGPAAQ